MTFTTEFWILFLVALACCAVGFYKYVYFISIGYGFAIAGQGVAMLVLFREHLTAAVVIACAVLILYGIRLSGFLLIREIKSQSYQKHMDKEIKDGSSMKLGIKMLLWVFCAALYLFMIAPIYYRFKNGDTGVTPAYMICRIAFH